jgi:hypothetical protein
MNGTFTWYNRRSSPHQIACILDLFLISKTSMLEGPMIEENILPKLGSDHCPVQILIDSISMPKFKPFLFEKVWLNHQ